MVRVFFENEIYLFGIQKLSYSTLDSISIELKNGNNQYRTQCTYVRYVYTYTRLN